MILESASRRAIPLLGLVFLLGVTGTGAGCGDDDALPADASPQVDASPPVDAGVPDAGELVVPATYEFDSHFVQGTSSVSYRNQIVRQVLIADLGAWVEGLTAAIDSGMMPDAGEVRDGFLAFYQFDGVSAGQTDIRLATMPATLQQVYADLSAAGANLAEEMVGVESSTDYKDWSTQFAGWSANGPITPDGLVRAWIDQLDDLAWQRGQGLVALGPTGAPITKVYVTAEGLDLKQLTLKICGGGVAYAQAMDRYLDAATDGKGLRSPNQRDADAPYTTLEHAWDEGFGYFGAARDYNDYTDQELAAKGGRPGYASGYHDADGDGTIDLLSEYNFGASLNAARRDLGSDPSAPTDFTQAAMDAFLRGRAIIADAAGELTPAQLAALAAQRDLAIAAWEMALGATLVSSINAVLVDMGKFGAPAYVFEDHARHWSELKGAALSLQFNPFAHVTEAQFAALHALLRDAPVLPNALPAEIDQYRADLLAARDLLQAVYGFDFANVGDADGTNGW